MVALEKWSPGRLGDFREIDSGPACQRKRRACQHKRRAQCSGAQQSGAQSSAERRAARRAEQRGAQSSAERRAERSAEQSRGGETRATSPAHLELQDVDIPAGPQYCDLPAAVHQAGVAAVPPQLRQPKAKARRVTCMRGEAFLAF
jgi:hypothetical protein